MKVRKMNLRLSGEVKSRCWSNGSSVHGTLECRLSFRPNYQGLFMQISQIVHKTSVRREHRKYKKRMYQTFSNSTGSILKLDMRSFAATTAASSFQGLLHLQIGNMWGDNNLCKTSTTLERKLSTNYESCIWERHLREWLTDISWAFLGSLFVGDRNFHAFE